jgi:hypothetical protein
MRRAPRPRTKNGRCCWSPKSSNRNGAKTRSRSFRVVPTTSRHPRRQRALGARCRGADLLEAAAATFSAAPGLGDAGPRAPHERSPPRPDGGLAPGLPACGQPRCWSHRRGPVGTPRAARWSGRPRDRQSCGSRAGDGRHPTGRVGDGAWSAGAEGRAPGRRRGRRDTAPDGGRRASDSRRSSDSRRRDRSVERLGDGAGPRRRRERRPPVAGGRARAAPGTSGRPERPTRWSVHPLCSRPTTASALSNRCTSTPNRRPPERGRFHHR